MAYDVVCFTFKKGNEVVKSKQRREEVVSVFRQTCLGWRTPIGHSVNGKVDQAVTRLCAQAAKGWK